MFVYTVAIVLGLLTLTGADECANKTPKDALDQFCFPGAGCSGPFHWSTEKCDEFCTKHNYQIGACLSSDRYQCCCYNNLLKCNPLSYPKAKDLN
ncbi:hypothetical protein AAVH_38352 [Aphelenchoides avenae]|nr:hypothetical protein AAVH_38352 [Aphelenchus avenae]